MTLAVSLLRGINVGGRNKIRMADLRELYVSLGMKNVRSLLQSGNVIFETALTDLTSVKLELEAGIHSAFGLDIQVLLRSSGNFEDIIARHPFSAEQLNEPRKAAVVFLSDAPESPAVDALSESNPGREVIHAAGCELYIFYTDGMARSKLDNKRIESRLGLIATARNWNTCIKLQRLLAET
ncbi:MAG: DUF1697 domain-containing protein [Chloroflexota bacterium]|nr:DUF1697 domain-containing protein [Chloroflexota bacterium]